MKIWKLELDVNNYEALWPVSERRMELAEKQTFDGRSKIAEWTIMETQRPDQDNPPLPFGNVASFYTLFPAFDDKALDVLSYMMKGAVEILPLDFEGVLWYGVYTTRVLDALDLEKSECVLFSSGRIMRIAKYVFMPELISDIHIFKIPEDPLFNQLVSDEYKIRAEEAGLTGFRFILVWDSEAT